MQRSATIAVSLAITCSLGGSSSVHDPCIEVAENFLGSYKGVAIALYGGSAWFALPLRNGGRCTVGIDGDFALYQKMDDAWKTAEFGDEHLRAIHVDLKGKIVDVEINDPAPRGRTSSPWFQVDGTEEVSSQVTFEDADAQFELIYGMTIKERNEWIRNQRAKPPLT